MANRFELIDGIMQDQCFCYSVVDSRTRTTIVGILAADQETAEFVVNALNAAHAAQEAATAKYQPASEEEIERSYQAQSDLETEHPEWLEPGGFLDPKEDER